MAEKCGDKKKERDTIIYVSGTIYVITILASLMSLAGRDWLGLVVERDTVDRMPRSGRRRRDGFCCVVHTHSVSSLVFVNHSQTTMSMSNFDVSMDWLFRPFLTPQMSVSFFADIV